MPDIARPAPAFQYGLRRLAPATATPGPAACAAVGQFKAQGTRHRVRFRQPEFQLHARRIGFTGFLTDQCLGGLIITKIFAPQIARGDQPVRNAAT